MMVFNVQYGITELGFINKLLKYNKVLYDQQTILLTQKKRFVSALGQMKKN